MTRSSSSWRTQIRVLRALMVREMITRYGRSPLGYLWAVIEPAAVIALLSLIFSQIAHTPPEGRSFPLFYATGYVAFHWFHDISSVTARSVHVNRALLAFPKVSALDTVLARFLLQALTGLAVAGIVFGAILLVFEDPVDPEPGWLMTGFGLAMGLGLGLGLANVWLFAVSRSWEIAWNIVSRPLFLISCVFFSFESLPRAVQEVLWYNPLIHVVGAVRAGIYPTYDPVHVAPGYVAAIALGLGLLGLFALRAAPGKVVAP